MPVFFRLILLFLAMVSLRPAFAADYTPDADLQSYVWEYPMVRFNYYGYKAGVETLFRAYEHTSDKSLKPGEHGVVGIKIYTASGPGMRTPPNLVRAVVACLEERGFDRKKLFLIDSNAERLRESGYLPRRDTSPNEFEGIPVYALDSGDYYDKEWSYDSNLPSRERVAMAASNSRFSYEDDPEERKSYLAYPLISQVDFWINLPMASDNKALGISGALANATLWNISNNTRFLASPANAPVAVAEIAAIPELRETWVFTLQTLERYQFMGGPRFNSLYTGQEPKLWLSANPVAIDYLMWRRIYNGRARERFPVPDRDPQLFEYAQAVGLGNYKLDQLKLVRLQKAEGSDSSD
ncbi:DUF362 domain-containing protein [Ruficoccus amylovorans]|uniref:DUF362 domain-containing protein n=1 Tax=Ruficoccus amylovorans TaxID=1804625 RepID=A0A842HBL1_9BACT|nr:DUF362 domain-containing protein [Ruficoccus amylovorans]MBC2593096.1 DUF362 domain-containing protein [Ruficoccus amylovorans]